MNQKKQGGSWSFMMPFLIMMGITIILVFSFSNLGSSSTKSKMNSTQFIAMVESAAVDNEKNIKTCEGTDASAVCTYKLSDIKLTVTDESARTKFSGTFKETKADNKTKTYSFVFYVNYSDTAQSERIYAAIKDKVPYTSGDANAGKAIQSLIINILPIVILVIGAGFIIHYIGKSNRDTASRGMDFGKSTAKEKKDITVKFDDVAGCEEEKAEMVEIVEYLKRPKRFTDMGARIPKGVILKGPPGTGKTLLAKAIAGEAGVPFYYISGSDFVEMFVGVGASRVRDMFRKAKAHAPSMLFIDEIDAVGRQRGAGLGGGNDEREQTLNQLLVELDGFGENSGVIVIAATNRPDVLDPALLRSGRFDRQITVHLPDKKGREGILKVHARNKKVSDKIDFSEIASRTPGFSGAELENVLNEAAIMAVRNNHEVIITEDVDEAIDRVMSGPAKKSKKYTIKERTLIAYHEAGHAIIGLKVENAEIVQKVTIIPRGEAGGYTLMMPEEEHLLQTKGELLDHIVGLLGGRVSEEVFFDDITTGAHNDIERATRIARLMVTEFGMSALGPIQYEKNTSSVFLGRDYASNDRNFSSETASAIDHEVRNIIDRCYQRAKSLIEEHRELITLVAQTLLVEETLTNLQIKSLVATGKLPETQV